MESESAVPHIQIFWQFEEYYKTEQSQGIISGKLNLCDVQVYSEQAIFINVLQIIWSTFFCKNIQK